MPTPSSTISSSAIVSRYPAIVDGSTILFSEMYIQDKEDTSSTIFAPSSDEVYFDPLAISSSDVTPTVYYIDGTVLTSGGTPEAALKSANVSSSFSSGYGYRHILLGSSTMGFVSTQPGIALAGDVPGGVVGNMFPYATGNDTSNQLVKLYRLTRSVSITSPYLSSLGITNGWWDTDTVANRPYAGMNFTIKPRIGQVAFFRFYLQSDASGLFGDPPSVYLWTEGSSPAFVAAVPKLIKEIEGETYALREYVAWVRITRNDFVYWWAGANTQRITSRVKIAGLQYHCSDSPAYWIDRNDYPTDAVVVNDAKLAARDAANMLMANQYQDRVIANVQKPTADYNLMVVTGQSLAEGVQTQFAISQTPLYGNVMLGDNVWPNEDDGDDYPPFGGLDVWKPLVPTPKVGATTYTNSTSPDVARGEPWNCGWLNMVKYLFNQLLMTKNDPRKFASINCAIGGKTIEQLSKVNNQDSVYRFGRLVDGLRRAKLASGASSIVMVANMFGQGEYDYMLSAGSTNRTRALYKAKYSAYIDSVKAEAFAQFPDQMYGPAFYSYITGGAYTADTDANGVPDLFVAMAQMEVALERDDVWVVGPIHPYPDKGGHPTANGSRWYSNMVAKVQHRVQHLGQDWSPLRPIRLELIDDAIYIDYHVPEPPLQWKSGWVIETAIMYPNKGYRVIDMGNGNVNVPFTVEIVGKTIVRINLIGSHTNNLAVYYCDKTTHNGNGNLCDSDPTIAHDKYIYDPLYMPPEDNILSLVGKPYPLENWGVPFFLPVGYGVS